MKSPFFFICSSGKAAAAVGITQVQHNVKGSTASATSHNIVFGSPPTSGNVLILCVVSDTTVLPTPPTGWTTIQAAVGNSGTYMYWKTAGVSESSTVTVTISASDSCVLSIYEYSNITTLDQSAQLVSGSNVTAVPTGTTSATTAANELIVCLCGMDDVNTVTSWSNSIVTDQAAVTTGSVTNVSLTVGIKIVSATGTQTSTATVTGLSNNPSGIIATFK